MCKHIANVQFAFQALVRLQRVPLRAERPPTGGGGGRARDALPRVREAVPQGPDGAGRGGRGLSALRGRAGRPGPQRFVARAIIVTVDAAFVHIHFTAVPPRRVSLHHPHRLYGQFVHTPRHRCKGGDTHETAARVIGRVNSVNQSILQIAHTRSSACGGSVRPHPGRTDGWTDLWRSLGLWTMDLLASERQTTLASSEPDGWALAPISSACVVFADEDGLALATWEMRKHLVHPSLRPTALKRRDRPSTSRSFNAWWMMTGVHPRER